MKKYADNAKWLVCFAPFRVMSVSAAYITPFFLQKGLSLTAIFALQSVFSLACVVWEIPSGYIADRIGRAFSIKLSAPIAAVTFVAYGLSSHLWQFVLCELVLAFANGLISGVDTALLVDSLKADGYAGDELQEQQVLWGWRAKAAGWGGTLASLPLAILLVLFVNLSSTIVADGLLIGLGSVFAFRLVEAPRTVSLVARKRDGARWRRIIDALRQCWHDLKQIGKITRGLVREAEVRWLVVLGTVLAASTYIGFWLTVPYYHSLGIPAVAFSSILAARNAVKALLSSLFGRLQRRFRPLRHGERNMAIYAALAGTPYLAMATGQVWLMPAVLGHDVVHALADEPISAKLNNHFDDRYRATLNSMVNMVERLLYSLAGPVVGVLIGLTNLHIGFVVLGVVCGMVGLVALSRLHELKTFRIED